MPGMWWGHRNRVGGRPIPFESGCKMRMSGGRGETAIPRMHNGARRCARAAAGALALLIAGGLACDVRADGIIDIGENSVPPFDAGTHPVLFPNWLAAHVSSFWVWECDDAVCTTCTASAFTGLTVVNLGTATGGPGADITGVYWNYGCGAGATAITT